MNLPQYDVGYDQIVKSRIVEYDNHVIQYDAHVFVAYRVAAKQRDDRGMTHALKWAINVHMKSLRFMRIGLLRHYPDYLKG